MPKDEISVFKSCAAVLVKVMANIVSGETPASNNLKIRFFIAKLFPDPGPATARMVAASLAAKLYAGESISIPSFHAIYSHFSNCAQRHSMFSAVSKYVVFGSALTELT
jgi:hypothetical protein